MSSSKNEQIDSENNQDWILLLFGILKSMVHSAYLMSWKYFSVEIHFAPNKSVRNKCRDTNYKYDKRTNSLFLWHAYIYLSNFYSHPSHQTSNSGCHTTKLKYFSLSDTSVSFFLPLPCSFLLFSWRLSKLLRKRLVPLRNLNCSCVEV